MIATKIIFVRHGQSQANADGVIANADSPLTDVGLEQARKTGNEIKNMGIARIICSPYLRAQQTAETIAGELGVDLAHIRILDELRERGLGVHENQPKEHDGLWYFTDEDSEGIEPRQELFERMKRCLEALKDSGDDEVVLAVGHSISGFYLTQVAMGKTSLDEFDSPELMSNADYIELTIT